MANIKSGAVSWTDASFDSSKKTNSKDTFLRLGPGSNVVRLLTLPHQYQQHKHEVEGGKKFGYRINCSKTKEGEQCAICEMGAEHKPKRRWLLGVIERKTNTYKILDIGYAVFKSIQTLQKDDDWGDPSRYDIDIVVDPNGGSTGYYTVVAKPPKPLTASDLVIQEENGTEELVRRTTPPEPSKVVDRLRSIDEEIGTTGNHGGSNSHDSGEKMQSSGNDEEDDGNFFKNYDTTKKPERKSAF